MFLLETSTTFVQNICSFVRPTHFLEQFLHYSKYAWDGVQYGSAADEWGTRASRVEIETDDPSEEK